MIAPKDHAREQERIAELKSYNILDSLPDDDYDDLTKIAAQICNTPISLISLLDENRQWFKSHFGLEATETPKEYAFCAHAINEDNSIFMIEDARKDERFWDNPIVIDETQVIFYAGVPLITENGLPLGTLCVIDNEPNKLDFNQITSLKAIAKQVMHLLDLRKKTKLLEESISKLELKNKELESFAYVAAHDLKSPLNGISSMMKIFVEDYSKILDSEGREMLDLMLGSSTQLSKLIDGLLKYSKSDNYVKEEKFLIKIKDLKKELQTLFSYEENLKISVKSELKSVSLNKTALDQVLINLVTNAIKYNDKEKIKIELGISEDETHYTFYVKDNGQGIAEKYREKIFEAFQIVAQEDRYGNTGNGIGLATVSKIVNRLGGEISLESEVGVGSKFIFTVEK